MSRYDEIRRLLLEFADTDTDETSGEYAQRIDELLASPSSSSLRCMSCGHGFSLFRRRDLKPPGTGNMLCVPCANAARERLGLPHSAAPVDTGDRVFFSSVDVDSASAEIDTCHTRAVQASAMDESVPRGIDEGPMIVVDGFVYPVELSAGEVVELVWLCTRALAELDTREGNSETRRDIASALAKIKIAEGRRG